MRSEPGQKQPVCFRDAAIDALRFLRRWRLVWFLLYPPAVAAQLPLSIEALLIPPSTLTLSTRTDWRQDRQSVLVSRRDAADRTFLAIGERQVAQGGLSVGLRYGVLPRLELSGRLAHRRARWRDPQGAADQAEGYTAALGLTWLVRPERGAPALLLDLRTDLVSARAVPGATRQWLDAVELGATFYRSLDPVVLSLSARYRRQREADPASGERPVTGSVLLAPQVNFAVNSQVTLVGGLSAHYRDVNTAAMVNKQPKLAAALRLGVGYAASRRSTFFLNSIVATSDASRGAGVDLEWLYRLQ